LALTKATPQPTWLRDELLHLLSLSGTLDARFCLALTGMVATSFIMAYTVW